MCQGARRLLKRGDPLCTGIPYAAECIIFQGVELVLCVEDTVLQFLEALGRITFGADQGLFADIIVGYKIFKGIGDLKIVSENLVPSATCGRCRGHPADGRYPDHSRI